MSEPGLWRRADAAWVGDDERAVILPLTDVIRQPVVLEGSGAILWRLLDEELTLDELAEHVAAEFEIPAAAARADIEPFLRDLRAIGVVETEDTPTAERGDDSYH